MTKRIAGQLTGFAALVVAVVLILAPAAFAAGPSNEHSPTYAAAAASQLSAIQIAQPGGGSMQAESQTANHGGTEETCSECLYLDTYDASHTTTAPVGSPWILGPVTSANFLASGKWYVITISGDVSYWAQDDSNTPNWTTDPSTWTGTPGNPPRYPSTGTANGYTGFDWEYLFAVPYPKTFPPPDSSFPHHIPQEGISLNGPAGPFTDLIPIGGQTYHPDHVYKYFVQGLGMPASIQVTDSGPTSDNSGMYKICIQAVCGDDGGGGGGQPSSCVDTQGYWGNKPGVFWPDPYSRAATFFLSGQTWQQVLDTAVSVSPGYYQLADQYIAAVLNQANGAPVPSGVQDILNQANTWFGANAPGACTASGSCNDQKNWASTLDTYNNGLYPGGPSHCD